MCLSSLANQCDALFNEVMKLRSLRKARHGVEMEAAAEVVRSHSDEVRAIGQTLAANRALNVSSIVRPRRRSSGLPSRASAARCRKCACFWSA